MRKLSLVLALVAGFFVTQAKADVTGKDASAATITWFDYICFTTKHCSAGVTINSAGTEVGTTGNPFQTGAPAAAYADGWDATQGAKADAVCGTATGTCSIAALIKYLNTVATAAVPVTDQVGGAVTALVGDPCQTTAKTTVEFTLATAAVKVAITGVSAKKLYICAYELNNNAADSIAIFEATTGTTCATAAAALVGAGTSVATAGTGFNFAANGGIARGNGAAQVLATKTNAADLCIAQSAATQLTGSFTYAAR